MKKYASQLFDPSKIKGNRLNVIYAPMGSGKTTLFHEILNNNVNKCLMIAPYKSCLDDYKLTREYGKGLNSQFLYPPDLINTVINSWPQDLDLTDVKEIAKATNDYVNNLPPLHLTYILFDEVDFMWDQALMEEISNVKYHAKDIIIWEYILKALSHRFTLIGQTSTRIPDSKILNKGGQIQKGALTSVRFDSITPILVNRNVNNDNLFKIALDSSMDKNGQLPTLVYKSIFSHSDISYMDEMVNKHGKRVLVVMRAGNSPMTTGTNGHPDYTINQIGAVEAQNKNMNFKAQNVYFKLVKAGTALDKITDSADPYKYFDYIFINTSSSRQVSLKAVRGDSNLKVRVITIGNELNSTIHQAAGRFRENRVEIIHYLKGYNKSDLPLYSAMELWKKLYNIDPVLRSYFKFDGVKKAGSIYWPYIDKQQKRQAEWLSKTVKGKATQNQNHRLNVIKSWLKSIGNQKQTHASYQSYCKSLGEKPYNKNLFPSKLKEAKKTNKHP